MTMKKGSNRVIAAMVTFSAIIAFGWLGCTKSSNSNNCYNLVCENGAVCQLNPATKLPTCSCPKGYEGPTCSQQIVTKFLGPWNLAQTITGSDSAGFISTTTYYPVTVTASSTPTTFFINNFVNDRYYNQIVCTLDSMNSDSFIVDTFSAYHLLYDHYHILYGSGGINSTNGQITINLATRHLSATSNWINDTMTFVLTQP